MVKLEEFGQVPDMFLEPHAEDAFYKEERVAFSPITANTWSLDNLALILLIAKFSKTAEDKVHLKQIIVKYLDSCARIVEAVEDACHSNWLTALNNQHIAAAISHRIGLIDDGGYIKIMDHYRSVFDKMLQKGYVTDTVGNLTTLVQGSRTAGKETGATGLGALAAILKELKI